MAKATVLIVEDEQLVLEIVATEFADAGYEVLTADTADAAIAQLGSDRPIDLLFTDIRLPGALDGWQIASAARVRRPHIPVIYATGFSARVPAAVEGSLFFTKPYRVSEILAAVQRLL